MKYKILFIVVIVFSLFAINTKFSYSQENQSNTRKFISQDTSMSAGEYYKKYHARKPFNHSTNKDSLPIPLQNSEPIQKSSKSLDMPESFWFPGEFEEVQDRKSTRLNSSH